MPKWVGYHVKPDGRAYFRPYVPKDLKEALGAFPMVNLRMKDSKAAERLALMHYIAFERLIADKRRRLAEEALRPRPRPLSEFTEEGIRDYARQLAQGFNRTQHAALRAMHPREELLDLHEALSLVAGDVLAACGSEGLSRITEVFLTAAGIPYARDEANFKALVFELAEALDEDFIKPSSRRLHGREAVPAPPLPDRTAPTSAPARLTVGRVVDAHIAGLKQNGYTRKVVRCLGLFREVIGADTPVTDLRQRHVTDFLRAICRLPTDWATRFDKGTATIPQMLAQEHPEVMSPKTYTDNYRAPLKAFLSDAHRDHGDEGFPRLTVDRIEYTGDREEGEDQQRALTLEELRRLFEGAEYAALAEDPEGEALYWLPLVALFTGARPREICQLNPQCDFGTQEGIPYLDFDQGSPAGKGVKKTIKTGEARRIPLHPELVRLGFVVYLERLKAEGADRLFPTLRVKKGNPYEAAGQLVTGLLKDAGLYDNTAPPGRKVLSLYVMRKTFITHASNQKVVSRDITGHGAAGETAIQRRHYITEPEPLKLKDRELRKLKLPLKVPKRPA